MENKNTSHLAGEFLVAGELSRRGYPVSITMGNAKSVDIYADTRDGVIRVDAKAGRGKGNWPIAKNSVNLDAYYIFVYLQKSYNKSPEYFVISGKDIISKDLIKTWQTRQGIPYSVLNESGYREAWGKLPPP
jgi:hypothetical protein